MTEDGVIGPKTLEALDRDTGDGGEFDFSKLEKLTADDTTQSGPESPAEPSGNDSKYGDTPATVDGKAEAQINDTFPSPSPAPPTPVYETPNPATPVETPVEPTVPTEISKAQEIKPLPDTNTIKPEIKPEPDPFAPKIPPKTDELPSSYDAARMLNPREKTMEKIMEGAKPGDTEPVPD